jgi:hypothetical protein
MPSTPNPKLPEMNAVRIIAGRVGVAVAMLFLVLAVVVLVTRYSGWPIDRKTVPILGDVPAITGVSRAALIVTLSLLSVASGVIGIGWLVLEALHRTQSPAEVE